MATRDDDFRLVPCEQARRMARIAGAMNSSRLRILRSTAIFVSVVAGIRGTAVMDRPLQSGLGVDFGAFFNEFF
jgi:hypothetical protein